MVDPGCWFYKIQRAMCAQKHRAVLFKLEHASASPGSVVTMQAATPWA